VVLRRVGCLRNRLIYQTAEINRYFNSNIFSFPLKYENRHFQKIVEKVPIAARLAQRIQDEVFGRYYNLVNNVSHAMEMLPLKDAT
jgi:hypothetical protein